LAVKKSIAIIGGGAAALVCAARLDASKYTVTIYEKNAALGRKFLVAGDGGFNLTHSENIDFFIQRYTPNNFLQKFLHLFTNEDLRIWLKKIGIETYVGSSKRVYPVKGIKPIAVLNAILEVLKTKNISIKTRHQWLGWNTAEQLLFENGLTVAADIAIFALGGASWPVTGSTGSWLTLFEKKGISTVPFQASNCGYKVDWEAKFISKFHGSPLKNIALQCSGITKKGELIITKLGLEGGAIYALSAAIRTLLNANQVATIYMDLKPDLSVTEIITKLNTTGKKNVTAILKNKLHCTDVVIALLKNLLSKEEFTNIVILANKIKNLPIPITNFGAIDKAISTVGGIALTAVTEHLELQQLPHHYVMGEMLDWDAPTGGYLLQACFSMGYYVAQRLNGLH
jgi:uncharacterized flavoprotein (TIGR03862 family)